MARCDDDLGAGLLQANERPHPQIAWRTDNCWVDFVQPGEWLMFTVNISDAGPWDLVMPVGVLREAPFTLN